MAIKGADLGLLAGGFSQSLSYVALLTARRGGGRDDTCVVLLTEWLILAGC